MAQEYLESGRLDAASRLVGHVLATMPEQPDGLHLAGVIALRRGRTDEAACLLHRAVAGGGHRAVLWRSLSEVHRLRADCDAALSAARRAVALDPADPLNLFTLAMAHYERMELGPCIAAAQAALDLRPDLPQAHMKLAQAYLVSGDLASGWDEYEWRYRIPGAPALLPPTDRPHWDGTPLAGDRRLLLIADQGYGDVVMFARYLPWVFARAAEVTLACSPELGPLVRAMQPGLATVSRWEDAPRFDCYCPLSGLPRLHGTTLSTIPGGLPYLVPDAAQVEAWRARLDAALPAGLRRVGLAWAGRPTHHNDASRSTTLAMLAPLATVPGIALVSLQKGPAAAQCAGYDGPAPLLDLDAAITDFTDTAAIIAGLDLVVSVDTVHAHLCGAMARPGWVMLPHAPDWRWLVGREDSPWYPSLRLFRPPGPRRWDALVGDVRVALEGWVAAK